MTVAGEHSCTVVREFGRAWESRSIERILGLLAEDVRYQNVPAPEVRGRDAVRRFVTPSLDASTRIAFEFLACTADPSGRLVLTERIDTLSFQSGDVRIPLMGVFELRDGLIAHWRDYFDHAAFAARMQEIGMTPGSAAG